MVALQTERRRIRLQLHRLVHVADEKITVRFGFDESFQHLSMTLFMN